MIILRIVIGIYILLFNCMVNAMNTDVRILLHQEKQGKGQTFNPKSDEICGRGSSLGEFKELEDKLENDLHILTYHDTAYIKNRYLPYYGITEHPSETNYRIVLATHPEYFPLGQINVITQTPSDRRDYGHLFGLYVEENYRNHGYAKKLLQAAYDRLKIRAITHAVVYIENSQEKTAAINLYSNQGFIKDEQQYQYVMVKKLEQ